VLYLCWNKLIRMAENTNNPKEAGARPERADVVEDILSAAPEKEVVVERERAEAPKEASAAEPEQEARPARRAEYGPQDIVAPGERDPDLMQVERRLEDRELWRLYLELSERQRSKFKQDGERLALQFRALLGRTDAKPYLIFTLIQRWLDAVPGVIDPYIFQAAKIKADAILKLIRERGENTL
jgi:hypothetical protein